jgi:hypothetical protein
VTALPGLVAVRAFMTVGGIAGYLRTRARPLHDVLPLGDAGQVGRDAGLGL